MEQALMFKAAAKTNEGHLIVLGLTHENLNRLRKGQPIRIDLAEMGMQGCTALIFSGKDEKAMAREMSEFIGPQTKILDRAPRWPVRR